MLPGPRIAYATGVAISSATMKIGKRFPCKVCFIPFLLLEVISLSAMHPVEQKIESCEYAGKEYPNESAEDVAMQPTKEGGVVVLW
jgi:hypothetical protein